MTEKRIIKNMEIEYMPIFYLTKKKQS